MSANNSHDLKQLKTRLAKARAEQTTAKEEMKAAQKRENDLGKLCKELEEKIATMERKKPIITEHAFLRYFERVLEYDLEAIERGLLTDQAISLIASMPNGKIPSIGCRLVVVNGTVVTVEKS